MKEIFREIGGLRPVFYFGDLDPQGVRIPVQASMVARNLSLPKIDPHLWSYERLLAVGKPQSHETTDFPGKEDLAWFQHLAEPVEALLRKRLRLAQEAVGWDFLQGGAP